MLTKKQTSVFNVIRNYIIEQGISPTLRELCDITGIKSTSTVHGYLDRLQIKGYITRHASSPRSIGVIKR